MKLNYNSAFLANVALLLLVITCPDAKRSAADDNEIKYLKEYAFCKCLSYGYKNDSMVNNDISFSVYTELGDYETEQFRLVDSVALDFANRIQPFQVADYQGKKAILYNCMQFYNSETLEKYLKKIAKSR